MTIVATVQYSPSQGNAYFDCTNISGLALLCEMLDQNQKIDHYRVICNGQLTKPSYFGFVQPFKKWQP